MTWQSDAVALGWPEARAREFADAVARQQGKVLLVTANVLALRTSRGALQRTHREHSVDCFAAAASETAHLDEWVRPDDR